MYVEVLGRVWVSGGGSEDLVPCRVEGRVSELEVLHFLRLRWTSVNSPSWLADDMTKDKVNKDMCSELR